MDSLRPCKGNVPTGGLLISAIGPAHKLWPHGNEMAFTLIPNFRITGIAAMLVGLALIIWSLAFVHRKNGATVLLLLFIVLLLVGGGVAQILFFPWIWLVATRIHHPLNGWRKILPVWLQKPLGKMWIGGLLAGSALLVIVLIISITGFVPGVNDPDTVLSIMLTCLGLEALILPLTFISGFAHDLAVSSAAAPAEPYAALENQKAAV